MTKVGLLLLCSVALRADVLYDWTVGGVSYSFTVPNLPAGNEIAASVGLKISGYSSELPVYACAQQSTEDCIANIQLASATNSIQDLNTSFGQAAFWLCWDAGASGCNTGIDVSTGAIFPTLNIGQYGTYLGTMDFTGQAATLTITDPPSADPASSVPEPRALWLAAAAFAFMIAYRKRHRHSRSCTR